MGGKGLEPPAKLSDKTAHGQTTGTDSGTLGVPGAVAGDFEPVARAWPTLGDEPRRAILEIVARADRWREFTEWSAALADRLISIALACGWNLRGKPRPAKTGSWYLSFERGGHKLCIRLANHHRRLANIINVVWGQGHERPLAEALRKLRAPMGAETIGEVVA